MTKKQLEKFRKLLLEQKAAKDCRLSWGLLVTGKGIPRKDCVIRSAGGEDDAVIGVVTSGTMSPTLKQGIALCLLDRGAKEGDEVSIAKGLRYAADRGAQIINLSFEFGASTTRASEVPRPCRSASIRRAWSSEASIAASDRARSRHDSRVA